MDLKSDNVNADFYFCEKLTLILVAFLLLLPRSRFFCLSWIERSCQMQDTGPVKKWVSHGGISDKVCTSFW